LQSLGAVLQESNKLLNPQTELTVKVRPFETGSFIMDLAMHIQQNPGYLAFLGAPEFIEQAKRTIEYLGLVKKVGEVGIGLLELLKKLKNGKPESVEKKGDSYEYHAEDGASLTVSAPVHNLYNNGVVNNYFFNIVAPAETPGVDGVKTFLKGLEQATGIEITKDDAIAVKAYSDPVLGTRTEVIENTSIYALHPKSGNYGENTGQWTFKIAGARRSLKAKIVDQAFLAKYTDGTVKFYAKDLLKARVHEKQTVEGSKVRYQNEILEVIEYRPAHPSERN
jgi:hypothetical protein